MNPERDPMPLRITVFLHSFEPGGVERVALRLSDCWRQSGEAVTVLLGRAEGAMQGGAPKLDYAVYSSGPIRTGPVETLWMIGCLWRHVRAVRPDVLFCAGNSYTVVAIALRLLMGRSCPPIVAKVSNALDRRDMAPPARLAYRLWLRLQARLIERWVGMAEPMRAEIADAMRLPANRIAIVEDPALSERELQRLAETRDRAGTSEAPGRLFLSAGRLAAQKRFELLIRAFARGAAAQDRLAILGEGPKRRSLQALIDRLGLADRVSLEGHVRDLTDWFARCDAFILASDYEGVPAVVIEAMAAGVPIIATDSSVSMDWLTGSGRFGRVVPRRDERALAAAIAEAGLMRSNPLGSRDQARRFTVERAAPAYLEIMRSLVREWRARNIPNMDAEIPPPVVSLS
jgi:glycosyltransferase involved in cell wall biosynthesis